jgi:predicted tellurium resistance membrane protein TerC
MIKCGQKMYLQAFHKIEAASDALTRLHQPNALIYGVFIAITERTGILIWKSW